MKYFKSIISVFITLLMLTSWNVKSQDLTFSDWDINDNDLISRSEFVLEFVANYVNDWNVVDDEYLDDEDFFLVTYGIWDVNNDELLSEEEWLYGYNNYFGDYILDNYVAVDTDGDGFIEYQEYYDVLYPTDAYVVWDVDEDSYLSEYELARAVFNTWDLNDSNFIEKHEYNKFDSYYLDI